VGRGKGILNSVIEKRLHAHQETIRITAQSNPCPFVSMSLGTVFRRYWINSQVPIDKIGGTYREFYAYDAKSSYTWF
jgi:hypothetical protein